MVTLAVVLLAGGMLGSVGAAEISPAVWVAVSGVTATVVGGGSLAEVPEPEGSRSGRVEGAPLWPYTGGVVSISKFFGEEASGSSVSRAFSLPWLIVSLKRFF